MKRPAIFFDRDNTLIVNDGYLGDPAGVVLVEGAADAVARARSLGYAVVAFSNQSGVARGMFSEQDVHRVNARLDELLADQHPQAVIDRHEFCPFHPEGTVSEYAQESDLRKPRPGMILQAAEKLALDLSRSWVVGDAPRDIEAGRAAGCRTIWYRDSRLPPSSAARELMLTVPDAIVSSLKEAMDVIAREALVRQAGPPEPATPPVKPHVPAPVTEPEPPAAPPPQISADAPEPARQGPRSLSGAKPLIEILAQKRAATATVAENRATPPSAPAPSWASTARLEELAEQILQEVRHDRIRDDADFSISKLLAGIVQIIALAVLAMTGLLYRNMLEPGLLLALFLQTFTIALLIMGRQK